MREELLDFISEYSFKPTQQEKEKDLGGKAKKDHKAWKDFKKIEESVATILSKNGSPFEVDGQCGNSGRWLNIPYIRIFDKKTAPNASKGVYITYLFSDDGKSLVLSLSLGGSGYDKKNLSDKEIMSLSDAISAQFAGKTSFSTGYTQGLLGTSNRAKGYEIGLPLFKKYNIGNIPVPVRPYPNGPILYTLTMGDYLVTDGQVIYRDGIQWCHVFTAYGEGCVDGRYL